MPHSFNKESRDKANDWYKFIKSDLLYENIELINKSSIIEVEDISFCGKVDTSKTRANVICLDRRVEDFIEDICRNKSSVGVLNFADFKEPGGFFLDGARSQEEILCNNSNLYPALESFRFTYYKDNKNLLNRGLYQDRMIYSPGVTFFSKDRKDRFKVDVITCSAPNVGPALRYGRVTEKETHAVLYNRIKFILQVAVDKGIKNIVLGAYGCGVYGNDPKVVSTIFKFTIDNYYADKFDNIYFVIPINNRNYNYEIFNYVLNK